MRRHRTLVRRNGRTRWDEPVDLSSNRQVGRRIKRVRTSNWHDSSDCRRTDRAREGDRGSRAVQSQRVRQAFNSSHRGVLTIAADLSRTVNECRADSRGVGLVDLYVVRKGFIRQ